MAGARFTVAFEDTVVWLTARAAMSAVARSLRIPWRSVRDIVGRIVADLAGNAALNRGRQ
ncbi:MAG: transposase family protein [Sciscionella sp.]